MTVMRQLFQLNDTGTMVDTGPQAVGKVVQWDWIATGDTGGNLDIGIYPKTDDTGDGWLLVSNVGLAAQLRASFSQTDTGLPTRMAMDRLRVKKIGAAGAGRLYVWIEN